MAGFEALSNVRNENGPRVVKLLTAALENREDATDAARVLA